MKSKIAAAQGSGEVDAGIVANKKNLIWTIQAARA